MCKNVCFTGVSELLNPPNVFFLQTEQYVHKLKRGRFGGGVDEVFTWTWAQQQFTSLCNFLQSSNTKTTLYTKFTV